MKKIKVHKNNVSYFMAGFKAGILVGDDIATPETIENEDYTTTTFKKMMLKFLRAYDSKETDTDGLEEMYKEYKTPLYE